MLHAKVVCVGVVSGALDGAAHAGSPVCARLALGVSARGPLLEGGKDGEEDGLAVPVGAGLEADVSHGADALEVELLGKVVASFVLGVGHVHGEGYVLETGGWGAGKAPFDADVGERQGDGRAGKNGRKLHVGERGWLMGDIVDGLDCTVERCDEKVSGEYGRSRAAF